MEALATADEEAGRASGASLLAELFAGLDLNLQARHELPLQRLRRGTQLAWRSGLGWGASAVAASLASQAGRAAAQTLGMSLFSLSRGNPLGTCVLGCLAATSAGWSAGLYAVSAGAGVYGAALGAAGLHECLHGVIKALRLPLTQACARGKSA